MKRIKFGNKNLDIKNETIRHVISAALSCPDITREAVSRRASVSLATAGKVLSALDDCRFTELKYIRDNRIGSPSKSHVLCPDLSVLVLDLSSSLYTAHIVFGKARRVISEKYKYNPAISFEDNVVVFLSNVGKRISKLDYSVSDICTVISDTPDRILYTSDATAAYVPRSSDLSTLNGYCARFFGLMPSLSLTKSEAIACAVRYDVLDTPHEKELSYVSISDCIDAFYLPKSAPPVNCNVDRLMIDSSTLLSDFTQRANSSPDMALILSRCLNFMGCAFSTDEFWVEIDHSRFSDIGKRVELFFKSVELTAPHIHYLDSEPPAAVLGASIEILCSLITSRIRGV